MRQAPTNPSCNSGTIAPSRPDTPRAPGGPNAVSFSECDMSEVIEYKSWVCLICGWIYNEAEGLPDEGIAPGTRFADIPDDWRCPLCDVSKEEFAAVEF
ncbi:Rubredoxin [Burkholderia singularis]|uniref:Rubredoxin n=2 Tax=Burkholderia singularis TaxID=1503053 RepID=A0A238H331_9BURK|nr:Rubredoxin [Burkholderia singularis]